MKDIFTTHPLASFPSLKDNMVHCLVCDCRVPLSHLDDRFVSFQVCVPCADAFAKDLGK